MAKTKWYLTTGRESEETKRNATHVLFGDGGVFDNTGWAWHAVNIRTDQRLFQETTDDGVIVAYTLGEAV